MTNAIVQVLREAAERVARAVEEAAHSVGTFLSETGQRVERSVQDVVERDATAARDLDRAAARGDETPHVRGGDAAPTHPTAAGAPTHAAGIPGPNPHRSLGEDPAHGGAFNQREYDGAMRVQEQRGVRLERSSDPSLEWVDQHGRTYDLMGPIPEQYFDRSWTATMRSLDKHVGKADYTPFDVSGLNPEQIARVKEYVARYGDRVFIVGE